MCFKQNLHIFLTMRQERKEMIQYFLFVRNLITMIMQNRLNDEFFYLPGKVHN